MSALCHGLVVELTFERSENVTIIHGELEQPAVRGCFHLRMCTVVTGTLLYIVVAFKVDFTKQFLVGRGSHHPLLCLNTKPWL